MRFLKSFFVLWAAIALHLAAAAGPVVLQRGNGAEPNTLDPQKASGQWENNIIGDMMIGLTTDNAKGEPIPGIAESWTVSDDGLVWTFKLRDAVWSDGVPVTADDFVFAYQRINDPKTLSEYKTVTHIIKNAYEYMKGTKAASDIGARAVDAKTLELTLTHPAPYLPYLLSHYAMYPVPKHAVEKYGDAWSKTGNYVSNGAYMLSEWKPNEYVKVVKNPKFWDAANVKIDEIFYYSQEDLIATTKRFRAGETDLSMGTPSQLIPELKRAMPDKLRIAPYLTSWYVVFNLTRDRWKDQRIREALGLAIDRETIANTIMAAGELPAYALVPPGIPNYPHDAKVNYAAMPLAERQAKARALLAEAGFGPDNPLSFEFLHPQSTDAKRIASTLQSMWAAIGVKMTPAGTETKTVYNNLRAQNFDVAWAGWAADFPDASSYLYLAKTASEEMNYSKWSDAAYDQLNIDADNERDAVKRGEMMNRAEQMLLDTSVMVPVYFAVSRNLVETYVSGWENALNNQHRSRWLNVDMDAKAKSRAAGPADAAGNEGGRQSIDAGEAAEAAKGGLPLWLIILGAVAALGVITLVVRRKK